MDYFAIKRERKDSLFCIYRTLRYRCFERLFYERNSYDSDSQEVANICEYLRENLKIIMDYRPPLLLLKVKFYKLFHKLTRREKNSKTTGAWSLGKYLSEDKYGLICSVVAELYRYFTFIEIMQTSINDCERTIEICEKKLDQNLNPEENKEQYGVFLNGARKAKNGYQNRLKSRFHFNTKKYQCFIDKKDLYAKFYAIDSQFNDRYYKAHGAAFLLPEDCIIEDEAILYNASDEAIQVI